MDLLTTESFKKPALTIEIVRYQRAALQSPIQTRHNIIAQFFMRTVETAILACGIHFLLCKSVYLPSQLASTLHNGFKWKHLMFFSSEGHRIDWSQIKFCAAKFLVINNTISKRIN